EGIVAGAAAVEFLAGFGQGDGRRARLIDGMHRLHARGQHLVERLWEGLHGIAGVRVYGPPPSRPRTPTISFTLDGHPAEDVARALVRDAVFVSSGDFYAASVIPKLGVAPHGLVRVGCACYTSEEETDRLLAGLRRIASH